MSKMYQVYGIGQAVISVLPPPQPFENPPTENQTNFEIGQIAFTPPRAPTSFFLYAGGGNWVEFANSSGALLSVTGTANQITASTVAGAVTLSIPSAFVAPGSITATSGAITATNGNLVLGTAGNKLSIATGTNSSVGTSAAMVAGVVTVTSTAVTASSQIIYSRDTLGGTAGQVAISAQAAGSFTLTSSSTLETSTFDYLIIN